jgi:hypothetical protein
MVELIVEMMVQLLHILGLVTKAIERKYWSKSDLIDRYRSYVMLN